MDPVTNFAVGTLLAGITSGATTLTLSSSDAAKFPPATSGDPTTHFNAVIWNQTDYPSIYDDPAREIVRVTNISGGTLTIQRPAGGNSFNGEGSSNTAQAHATAEITYKIAQVPTKRMQDDIGVVVNGLTRGTKTRVHPTTGNLQTSPDGGTNWYDIEAVVQGSDTVIKLAETPDND